MKPILNFRISSERTWKEIEVEKLMTPLMSRRIRKKLISGSILIAKMGALKLVAKSRQQDRMLRERWLTTDVVFVLCCIMMVVRCNFVEHVRR